METKRTALVTGASGGIGLELAKLFAKDKIDLVLVARSADKLNALASELRSKFNVQVKVIAMDLSQSNAAVKIYDQLKGEKIEIEYLVNNAGIGTFGKFHASEWKKDEEMIQLNIFALTQLTKLFVKDMVARKSGRILNVASTAAFQPGPLMSIYYASKSYVLLFTEAIANELEGTGVTATVLCPGPTETGFMEAASMADSTLFKLTKPVAARGVAEDGYRAMMKGKVVTISGIMNAMTANMVRLFPRSLVRRIARRINDTVS